MTIFGSCLCGKVKYEVTGALSDVDHCHCSMCRRQHGAAFATYADFDSGAFRWSQGEELVKIYEVAGGGGWCFCVDCGSTLAGTEEGLVSSIALGTVEGDPNIKPGSHIYVGSKAPWFDITDDLPQFDERSEES